MFDPAVGPQLTHETHFQLQETNTALTLLSIKCKI